MIDTPQFVADAKGRIHEVTEHDEWRYAIHDAIGETISPKAQFLPDTYATREEARAALEASGTLPSTSPTEA